MRLFRLMLLSLPFLLLQDCSPAPVGEEVGGYLFVEAEDYSWKTVRGPRTWQKIKTGTKPKRKLLPDPDGNHAATASDGAYLEALPDTRVTHADELRPGTNFFPTPEEAPAVYYHVYFNNPGRYYVWVRAHSTGTEDNGLHVGLNDTWPETGRRMQWCEGKNAWTWASKQRTEAEHCGVEGQIYLDIPHRGYHRIKFAMREDGFEFDAFVLTKLYVEPAAGA